LKLFQTNNKKKDNTYVQNNTNHNTKQQIDKQKNKIQQTHQKQKTAPKHQN